MDISTYDVNPGKPIRLDALEREVRALGLSGLIGINEVANVGLRFIFEAESVPFAAMNAINSVIMAHDPDAPEPPAPPTAEERLAALEDAMLELILGG